VVVTDFFQCVSFTGGGEAKPTDSTCAVKILEFAHKSSVFVLPRSENLLNIADKSTVSPRSEMFWNLPTTATDNFLNCDQKALYFVQPRSEIFEWRTKRLYFVKPPH
jgi:hypothetical protein